MQAGVTVQNTQDTEIYPGHVPNKKLWVMMVESQKLVTTKFSAS